VKTVQKAADLAMHAGSRLYTDSASSYRAVKGYVHEFVNHTQKEYARGDVHENRAECLFSLLKPYLRVFRGRYHDILIDADAGDTREVESALRVAERVIIPVQPAGLDVWRLGLVDDRVGEAKATNPNILAYVVLNRASPNPKDNDADEAREAVDGCAHVVLAHATICDRVAVKRAAPAGLTVVEYKPFDAKAAHAMQQLNGLIFSKHR
jgi:cellulose biosynthesis protein BcsQ